MGSGGKGHKFWCDKCQSYVVFSDFETCESICWHCESRENKARTEAAEAEIARLRAQLKQAQDDGRLMLASLDSGMWRRLAAAGLTRLEQELDSALRSSTEDDGERVPYAELYAYRRLLALGDFFDNPRGESPPVAALPEPEWYTAREADEDDEDEGDVSRGGAVGGERWVMT